MKKLLILLFFPIFLWSQRTVYSNLAVQRISLEEKVNRPLQILPSILVNAYIHGLIKGYYPVSPEIPQPVLNFLETSAKLGIKNIEIPPGISFSCCEENRSRNLRKRIPEYEVVLELIESKYFDAQESKEKYRTEYVRIVFVDPTETGPEEGVLLFKWEEIADFLEGVKLQHPRNEASTLSAKQWLELRRFSSYPVEISGRALWSFKEVQERIKRSLGKEAVNFTY